MNHLKIKRMTLLLACLLTVACTQVQIAPPVLEGEHSLIVHVEALQCCDGTLRLAVYHDRKFWMKDSGMTRGRIGFILADEQTIEIHGLPEGEYAIAVHQDVNGDGKLNRRLGLIPKEPYGFSNNVGKYGPASFKRAAIELDKDKEITITMHRPGS